MLSDIYVAEIINIYNLPPIDKNRKMSSFSKSMNKSIYLVAEVIHYVEPQVFFVKGETKEQTQWL